MILLTPKTARSDAGNRISTFGAGGCKYILCSIGSHAVVSKGVVNFARRNREPFEQLVLGGGEDGAISQSGDAACAIKLRSSTAKVIVMQ